MGTAKNEGHELRLVAIIPAGLTLSNGIIAGYSGVALMI